VAFVVYGREDMRTDFASLKDGDRITLIPNGLNPLHKKPIASTFQGGYFYCDGSKPEDGPDYYLRDVSQYNQGFDLIDSA
jgi:hypothetical protein